MNFSCIYIFIITLNAQYSGNCIIFFIKLLIQIHKLCKSIQGVSRLATKQQEIIRINCNLYGEAAEHFQAIKHQLGLKQNTEVVRLAVNEYFTALKRRLEEYHVNSCSSKQKVEAVAFGE